MSAPSKKRSRTENSTTTTAAPTQTKSSSTSSKPPSSSPSSSVPISTIAQLNQLKSPYEVQQLIDQLPYNTDDVARCPQDALTMKKVHCLDGALLAAAALRRIGYRGVELVFLNADEDDGHVIAVFRSHTDPKCLGAVAKSNFVGLRYREPVYRSLRELVMSYFEQYYNIEKKRTLRSFAAPLKLDRYDKINWETPKLWR